MNAAWDRNDVLMPNGCAYYLDIVGIAVPLVVGAVLLLGTWRYFRTGLVSTAVTVLAIPAGLLVGAVPTYTVRWLIDYYTLTIGPTELVLIAVAGSILARALVSAWGTARHLLDRSGTAAV